MALAIETTGLSKRWALQGVDLAVAPGRVFGVIGPNGSGKTTTMRLLLDLIRPSAGRIRVLGEDPRGGGPALRRRVGYLPGELRLDSRITGRDLLNHYVRLSGPVTPGAIDALAARLDLDLAPRVRTLSKGNKQKLGLVQAFMHRPALLVLDEPASGLDPLIKALARFHVRNLVVEEPDPEESVLRLYSNPDNSNEGESAPTEGGHDERPAAPLAPVPARIVAIAATSWGTAAAILGLTLLSAMFALAVGAITGRRVYATLAGAGIAGLGYAFNAIAEKGSGLAWLRSWSPYSWAYRGAPPSNGADALMWLNYAVAAVLLGVAVLALNRRDLKNEAGTNQRATR